jgi:SPX domain protein involved in polyphosphate accumulation
MRFAQTLKHSEYTPWKAHYIDYAKLKKLLRESDNASDAGGRVDDDTNDLWTEEEEGKFVEELVNVQLEKVNAFQVDMYKQLKERTSSCESKLEDAAPDESKVDGNGDKKGDKAKRKSFQDVAKELDGISKELSELEKFSRVNFTGFLKAAKKHDRKRGNQYKVRPLLQVRLSALPFNSEDYSPLLYRYLL